MNRNSENITKSFCKYITVTEAQARYSMCRQNVVKFAESVGALKRFGRNIRIDYEVMDNSAK